MSVTRLRIATQDESTPVGPILATRLQPPRSRSARIERRRLLQQLDQSQSGVVTLVLAPAGFGKTTLLSQWAMAHSDTTAWLSLDPAKNDPVIFFAYLVSAIRDVDPRRTAITLDDIQEAGEQIGPLVARLLNDIHQTSQPLTIILDDYHLIDQQEVHDLVLQLMTQAPPGMHLLLSSRSEPPLPLARLRVQSELRVLSASDLRFTQDETEAFCAQQDVRIAPSDLAKLHAHVNGWAAGLQMVVLSAAERPDGMHQVLDGLPGSSRLLQDYLLQEVLNQQSTEVRRFLLATALVDRFSISLYQAITGSSAGRRLLERITRDNLFVVALDAEGEWHQYHHIFRDFLCRQARDELGEEEIVRLYRNAGAWFSEHGLIDEAIACALASRDWPFAIELIRPLMVSAISKEEIAAVISWFRSVPERLINADLLLNTWYAWAMARSGDLTGAERAIARAERVAQATGDTLIQASCAAQRILCARYDGDAAAIARHIERLNAWLQQFDAIEPAGLTGPELDSAIRSDILKALLSMPANHRASASRLSGHVLKAERAAQEALAFAQAHGLPGQVQTAQIEHAAALGLQGRMDEAIEHLQRVLHTSHVYPSERRLALITLAEIEREQDRLSDARQLLQEARLSLAHKGVFTWLPQLCLAETRLEWSLGDPERALAHALEAIDITTRYGYPRMLRAAHAARVRIQLAAGDVGAALQWAHEYRLAADDAPLYERLTEQLVFARVLIAQDEPEDAISLLSRVVAVAEEDGRTVDVVSALVLLALANQELFELDQATTLLDRALRIAELLGFKRVFLDEGMPMARLLKVARRRGVESAYTQALLAALGEGDVTPARIYHRELAEPITARELEVLRLIAVGLTNKEIADELFISMATVKRHITNIYGKLGVSTRQEALRLARGLNLLRPTSATGQ